MCGILNSMLQGLPNIGSGAAGAGSLDFLRNSQQVFFFFFPLPAFVQKLLLYRYVLNEWYFFFLPFSFQFQALRAMVQANPQILQVFFFTLVTYYVLYIYSSSGFPNSCYCCSLCYKNLANKILISWDWFEIIKLTSFAW